MEDDLIFISMEGDLKANAILTNSTAQHRQPTNNQNILAQLKKSS
jgi:hypothetical protein